ncbi:dihydrodipicolinate synthase family protein [Arthrobacter sp. StoSoilB5]|uniref:dihydrodipicolinate synthase family protein n=1 Tax=Arthrobacter sp. StoSoilB5 TaxID=2830992 RepID=UPI001CC73E92|nr:dihydrodipicolinate synthase family protein [Arthrobacter sp. StoSoilB5]BCW45334.1 hypothetical protein StoSoilB5_25180 [Arthrobacter sp. StoSoilB5]
MNAKGNPSTPRVSGKQETLELWGMVATPFGPGGGVIDLESLSRLSRVLVERGCTSLVGLGVIAEPASLTMREKVMAMEAIAGSAGGLPVVASVMNPGWAEALLEARQLTSALPGKLSAIMVPVSSSDPREFRDSLRAVHKSTGLPVIVQDLPRATGIRISVEDLADTLSGLDFIQAVKCESEPTFTRINFLESRISSRLIGGFGGIGLIDDLRSGAVGMAAGISKPEVLASALQKWRMGDELGAAKTVGEIAGLINFETQQGASIAIRKEHWRRQGVIEHAAVRPPTTAWSAAFDAHSRFYGFV